MSDGIIINPTTGVSESTTIAFDDTSAGKVQIAKLAVGADGSAVMLPADSSNGLDVDVTRVFGTYAYAAGTSATTVDVPAGGRVRHVSVIASAAAATITIAGGNTITVPAGAGFTEQIAGDAPLGGDVVIGGSPASYYVAWTIA